MMRPSYDSYFLALACIASKMATCVRRGVGCVLVDKNRFVLSTGFNGPPRGFSHCGCQGSICAGANYASGEGLSVCEAIHAEINAILQCKDPMKIETAYCTTEPCRDCTKALLNTSCKRVVFLTRYSNNSGIDLWKQTRNDAYWEAYSIEKFTRETGSFLDVKRI